MLLSMFAQAPIPTPGTTPAPEAGPLPWVIAFLIVVAILALVCMPSRKA